MSTLTLQAKAWINDSYGPEDLKNGNDAAVSALSIFAPCHNMASMGYCLVGPATVTVEVGDEKVLIENKVAALKAEKARVLGDAQAKATELEAKIQNLLAITYEPAGA